MVHWKRRAAEDDTPVDYHRLETPLKLVKPEGPGFLKASVDRLEQSPPCRQVEAVDAIATVHADEHVGFADEPDSFLGI